LDWSLAGRGTPGVGVVAEAIDGKITISKSPSGIDRRTAVASLSFPVNTEIVENDG